MGESHKIQFISNFYDSFKERDLDVETVRRVDLLVTLSLLGSTFLISFGVLAAFQNHLILATIDFTGTVILLVNLFFLRQYKGYDSAVLVGLFTISLLFASLYVNGGVDRTSFVWYYSYPTIAVFLLGSRQGGFAILIMVFPILVCSIFGGTIPAIENYTPSFEARFLGAYGIVGYLAFIFSKADEKNRRDLIRFNRSLERTVNERTLELAHKNERLKVEVAERTRAEEKIALALKEKDVLLQEVHHRTKTTWQLSYPS